MAKPMFLVLPLTLLAGLANSQPAPVKLSAGLEAEILALGRSTDREYLTLSIKISNTGKNTVYLMLVGKEAAADNRGSVYDGRYTISGIAQCDYNNSQPGECVGIPRVSPGTQPLQAYTEIERERDIVVNFRLRSSGGSNDGPLVSFSAKVAYRAVADPLKDATLSEAEKQKQVRLMTLSFPPRTVTDVK